ncbi:uncharacterized protein A4U43_C08F30190 [Asparagus officinalis]|uniref:uncharacterized protein LOC109822571 isoform X1 n=1 Tax=Asparagus officinalis TaxID=4686 RepID=UPI00098E3A13|nr:uncharacterized protein LOC109822571 isoform X1 [Asparagus officinalis]XP_020244376.1 uncharacterized protein LOC109822571 isoform X2 [Asparagus officinalis]ONK61464.1 uncharacterized protein A4U43_C08F30190 [Asparagus officinalis]
MGDAAWGSWDDHGRPSRYGRPPQCPGSSQSAIPPWERRFCTSVCLVPWGRICAAKVSLSAYKNIAEWDDIAAFEAFQNSKARYWAHINGLPFHIPLPDPDMYIDKVDHKTVIDPKLVEDLEKQPMPSLPDKKNERNNGWDSLIVEDKPIPATGWGDAEENTAERHSGNWDKFIEQPHPPLGWNNVENCNNSWNDRQNNSWNDRLNNSWGQHWNNLNSGQGGKNSRKRNGGDYDSRFSKSRQMDNNYKGNRNNWSDYTERNIGNYQYENTMRGGQPVSMRQSRSRWNYGQSNHQRSGESGSSCQWKKSVS